MARSSNSKGLRMEEFQVNPEDRPGWVRASVRTPGVGEEVYCAGGEGVVLSVRGKTGDGSPLVQIRLDDPKAPPFFAAASNVLVMPAR
jgi:hypothetical protein